MSRHFIQPVDFDLVVGNYYQVFEWLKSGEIDGAVVSPFIAELLADRVVPVVEFVEHNDLQLAGWTGQGQLPLIRVCKQDRLSDVPLDEYRNYVRRLWNDAEVEPDKAEAEQHRSCQLRLVSHLSSSGFAAPVLAAESIVSDLAEEAPHQRKRFWQHYFGNACFRFSHGYRSKAACPGEEIYEFSYSGRKGVGTGNKKVGKQDGWRTYSVRTEDPATTGGEHKLRLVDGPSFEDEGVIVIPNDMLVVRRAALEKMIWNPDRLDHVQWCPMERAVFKSSTGYTACHPYDEARHLSFREAIRQRRTDVELRTLWSRWYGRGEYSFTIDDILWFLYHDRELRGEEKLALVLPGGGVKAAYQSRMIDFLYGCDKLRNRGDERLLIAQPRDPPQSECSLLPGRPKIRPFSAPPLVVDTIVGTSGGALAGIFAAQVPQDPTTGAFTPLGHAWASPDGTVLSHWQLFHPVDSLRWVSLLLVLAIFCVGLLAAKGLATLRRAGTLATAERADVPVSLAIVFIAALVFHSLCKAQWEINPDPEVTYLSQALARALIILTMHFVLTCVRKTPARALSAREKRGLWLLLLACLVAPLITSTEAREKLFDAAALGLPAAAALAYATLGSRWVIDPTIAADYPKALWALSIVLLSAAATMIAAGAPAFELIWQYWVCLLAGAVCGTVGVVAVGSVLDRRGRSACRAGLRLLAARQRLWVLPVTPIVTLLGLVALGIGSWIVLESSGLYGNQHARVHLRKQLAGYVGNSDGRIALRADVIVTGASIETVKVAGRRVRRGDFYFYLCPPEFRCALPTGSRVYQLQDLALKYVAELVMASGSPFPVLPPREVSVPVYDPRANPNQDGDVVVGADKEVTVPLFEGKLIDGGYMHNVPLDAAERVGARQVLIVRSASVAQPASDLSSGGYLGPLAANVGKLFSFMFDMSQILDDRTKRGLVVAAIEPGDAAEPPLLTDFREETVKHLIQTAEEDQWRRVGRIESWGLPNMRSGVRIATDPTRVDLAMQAWNGDVYVALQDLLRKQTPATAVFDFDNTCIKNDIGEAVFMGLVMRLAYRGSDPTFWALIRDEASRQELKMYWERHHADQPRFSLANPAAWSAEFRDYVVLFFRQYLDRLEVEGPANAYAWVVKLFAGMRARDVEALTREVWVEQLRLPLDIVQVTSERHGSIEINLGIRKYWQIQQLIDVLHARGWEVWIVSASSHYSVGVVAEEFGIPRKRVLGVELREEKGLLTSEVRTFTYREGKWDAIRERVRAPVFLAVGDSLTDLEMLSRSMGIALVVDHDKLPRDIISEAEVPRWLFQPARSLTVVPD